jgi:hypothetical protein
MVELTVNVSDIIEQLCIECGATVSGAGGFCPRCSQSELVPVHAADDAGLEELFSLIEFGEGD